MSENLDSQVEEVSPEVYRRRRIMALLVLVLALLLIIGLISWLAGRGESDSASPAATTSSSAEAFSDFSQRATDSASPSESASASESTGPTESASEAPSATESAEPTESVPASTEPAETAEPTPSEPTTPVAAVACTAADLQVNLTADSTSYAAGQNPALAVTYTNTSGAPCTVTGGANNVDVNITSGPAQVFNYAKCHANPAEDAEVAAGATNTTPLTWNRSLNVLGCDTTETIKPGYYWATATVNGVSSQPVRIIVTG
ncbi:hypothetical protein A7979_04535 [Rothia nasimurium]|uniref:DUF4232 domain-containing protein n=1 Tax=Rothia nasimurium TaxID=85336 RepID=A0A1Y1RP01_9MICC|nr:hypothetical protein [Rothia nasimurium]ORC16574.1 hypothetical protein A7979_04535 [Rothia nasimurium]